LIRHFKKT